MGIIKTAYPAYYKGNEVENAVTMWTEMFADDPLEFVALAVKAYIITDTKGFPPVIGQIKQLIATMTNSHKQTAFEAWGKVMCALNKSGYNSKEEFEKLNPISQRIIGTSYQLHQWSLMDLETVNTVIASNFQRSYEAESKKEGQRSAVISISGGSQLLELKGSEEDYFL